MISLLLAGVAAAAPSDLSMTSIGASGTYAPAVEAGEFDLLLGQRLRWTLSDGVAVSRALVDGRFTFDPLGEDLVRWQQLRQLGVSVEIGSWSLDVGRHPVRHGGPRLVDGVQGVVGLGEIELGVWGGLAPDLFTTIPRLRYGGGPIVAWTRSASQAALVGEVLAAEGGLDRVGLLATARHTVDRLLDASGRLDLELASVEGGPHLSDGQVLVIARPAEALRIDALYDVFSSYRYLQTEPLDPELQRFQGRLLQLGIDLGITQDVRDPSLNHLVGGGVRVQGTGDGLQPRVGVDGRYRMNPNPANRFARVHPQVALAGIPLAGALEVALDGNVIAADDSVRYDGGVLFLWEPGDDPRVLLDGSARWIVDEADYDGIGWYTDLFVDWITPLDVAVVAGASVVQEPYEGLPDLGVSGFLRITTYVRPSRR